MEEVGKVNKYEEVPQKDIDKEFAHIQSVSQEGDNIPINLRNDEKVLKIFKKQYVRKDMSYSGKFTTTDYLIFSTSMSAGPELGIVNYHVMEGTQGLVFNSLHWTVIGMDGMKEIKDFDTKTLEALYGSK